MSFDGVVIGGGFTGTLAALASIRGGNHVLLLTGDERDGQHRHGTTPHLLPWGSLHDIDMWVPELGAQLADAGARTVPLPEGLVTPGAPVNRWDASYLKVFGSSRHLFRTTLRANAETDHNYYGQLTVRAGTATGLLGSRHEINGVRVRSGDGTMEDVHAPLVVDCSGRASAARDWLTALGLPPTRRTTRGAGLAYIQQEYEIPGTPPHIVWDHSTILAPVEDGKWILARTTETPGDEDPAALRRPVIDSIPHIAGAEPVSAPTTMRLPPRHIHHYGEQPHWPRGFAVLGDAVATHHPLHGRAGDIAQATVELFHQELCRGGIAHPTLAERTQAAANYLNARAWGIPAKRPARRNRPSIGERAQEMRRRSGFAFR
ncbi:hypothetical protein AB0G74_08470 [Streptomyces sp. NPDC020875]|uniref:hypothetical protein n=1 Tax=Streptomyces sp. NPDC020875 TaxID=3154898 RepID=UPI0033D7C0FC